MKLIISPFKRNKIKFKFKQWTKKYDNRKSEINKKELYELDKLSLDYNHKERYMHLFEIELENIYDKKSSNDMNFIYDNKIYNIAEWNLLHDILNSPKCPNM